MKHPAYGLSFLNRLEKPGGAPPADQRSRRDLADYSVVPVQTASDTNGHKMQSSLRSFGAKRCRQSRTISQIPEPVACASGCALRLAPQAKRSFLRSFDNNHNQAHFGMLHVAEIVIVVVVVDVEVVVIAPFRRPHFDVLKRIAGIPETGIASADMSVEVVLPSKMSFELFLRYDTAPVPRLPASRL